MTARHGEEASLAWHAMSAEEALRRLDTSAKGLTAEEAVARRAHHGYNRLPVAR